MSLHERDRATLAASHAPLAARAPAEGGEDRPHEDTQHGAGERSIVGESVAETERQREYPLSHGDLGEDAVHQVRGRIGHAPATTRRAESSALAGEGDHAVESAVVAVHAHEAVGQDPAAQEAAELALDEARHDAFVRVGPGQEGLELRLDDAVEHAPLRLSAGVLVPSTPAVPVRRVESGGCRSGHAVRPLPGACPSRAASSAFIGSNRSKVAPASSLTGRDGGSRWQPAGTPGAAWKPWKARIKRPEVARGSVDRPRSWVPDSRGLRAWLRCSHASTSPAANAQHRRVKRDGDGPSEPTRRARPGRIRAEPSEGRGLLLRKVSARVRHREGRSRSKGRALGRPGYGPGSRQQRSIVKLQYVANKTPGGWRAHGRYLTREGAQREGDKGLGFDASESAVEIDRRLDGWQRAEDPRMWKMILSPERGEALDLVDHTRRVLNAMERDLGTRLEWVAVDHHNTDNPHVHVAIRGRDEAGRPLLLDREYVKHGARLRSRELATQALGYRTEADRVRARERGIEVQRFGELDAVLEQRMGPGRLVSFEDPVPASGRATALRLQLIGRLQFLERLGLASRAGTKTWRLSLDHRPALREMQVLGDIQKSLGRGDLGITDPAAARQLVRLEPGMALRGRIAGTAGGELAGSPFLVLEATDGRVLLVRQTPAMEERPGDGGLRRGQVVTLREHEIVQGGRRVRWTEIQEHGRLRDLVRTRELATVLDLEALERSQAGAPRGCARCSSTASPPSSRRRRPRRSSRTSRAGC